MIRLPTLSVRLRLQGALAILALLTAIAGSVAWIALERGRDRLESLNTGTLAAVDRSLRLSSQAADLAMRAPFLLALDSQYRIRQEGRAVIDLIGSIETDFAADPAVAAELSRMRAAVFDLLGATEARAVLRDRILRLNAEVARKERELASLSAAVDLAVGDRALWLSLQRTAAALLGAGRAENLIGLGEFHREFHGLTRRFAQPDDPASRAERADLLALAEGGDGLFELRRRELAQQVAADNALARIRRGAEAVGAHAAAVTDAAKRETGGELARTATSISVAKSTIVLVLLISSLIALFTARFVADYVTSNLSAIADAMMRLAGGDRSSRLPRGAGTGDEISKLLHAFRVFRSNRLRLDRSHRQRARQTALFETMVTGMSDGVAVLSPSGRLIASNERLGAVLGLEPAYLGGHGDFLRALGDAGWTSAADGRDYAELQGPDGRIVERRDGPLPDGGAVVLFSEATERRRIQERMEQIERIEALGKVAGEVAHDFGNILSTISGSLHLLETASEDRHRDLRQAIGSAVDLGSSLTQRLLAFARRQRLEPEEVDLAALLDGLADLVELTLREGIDLEITPVERAFVVRVDAGQLESAILNLCLNAAQAIEGDGRITVAVTAHAPNHVAITVSDTGCGMTADILAHAMEPFYSARRDGQGTGLGLAMVYGFIRQSNGDMSIESVPGAGTTVRLILPRVVGPAPDRARLLAGLQVVVVEDDPADADHARSVLTDAGARVTILETADHALARLAAAGDPPDVLLTDLHLCGEPAGWRIAEAALAAWPAVTVAVLSGRLPDRHPLVGRFGSRLRLIEKPLTPTSLEILLSLQPGG